MTINDKTGDITFATDFTSTTTENFLIVADWNAPDNGSFLNLSLPTSGITMTDSEGTQVIEGEVNSIQHNRNNKGGGGSSSVVGSSVPPGRSVETGGTNEGGELIGDDPNFKRPTAHTGLWANPSYAYDETDGTYAADTFSATTSYTDHSFVITSGNTIEGVEVKMEVSGTTAIGDIGVQLSWDGGATWTTTKTTPTLTTTDTVVSLGGASDLWGHAWTETEFSNANFAVQITGNPSSNAIQIDAIQVRVYHKTTGGGAGGGGAI